MSETILIISLSLQLIAVYFALRLIKITGRPVAWGCIASAITLMALRRAVTIYHAIHSGKAIRPDFTAEVIALTISLLMAVGLGLITPLFRQMREANEKILDAEIKLKKSLFASIGAIAATVEKRDMYTAGHQQRVANLAVAISREMKLPEELIEGLQLASLVHDVGKINIPAEILTKPARLSDLEYQMVKQHPSTGYDILREIEFPWPVARIVLEHQERLDGSGYPAGLKNKEILLESRILAVADVVEAMASDRPYRPAMGIGAAIEEISAKKDILFDKDAVNACLAIIKKYGYPPNI